MTLTLKPVFEACDYAADRQS